MTLTLQPSPEIGRELNDISVRSERAAQTAKYALHNLANGSEIIIEHSSAPLDAPKANREEVHRVGQVIHEIGQIKNDCRST